MLSRLKDRLFSVPLRFKIMGLALGLVMISGAVTIYRVNGILVSNMEEILRDESSAVARELAFLSREYLLINDLFGLDRLLKNTARNRSGVRYAFVVNSNNEVLAHSFSDGFPGDLLSKTDSVPKTQGGVTALMTNEGMVWDSYHPIHDGGEGVRVGIAESPKRKQIAAFLRSIFVHNLGVLLIAFICSGLLTFLITKPVKKLLEATRGIREGNYEAVRDTFPADEVGDLVNAFNAMLKQLQQAEIEREDREKMRREFLQRIISSQEMERKRVARELHDQTGQVLASMMVRLKMLEKEKQENLKDTIANLKTSLIEEMGTIHNLALELRPSVLDDMGLVPALQMYVGQCRQRYDLRIDFVAIGLDEKRADHCVETCVYRIIQESLTNIVKHARAKEVKILLEWRQEKLRGIIEDDGVGFDPGTVSKECLGIYGMEERAKLLGGSFKVDSGKDEGVMVSFDIPVKGTAVCHE